MLEWIRETQDVWQRLQNTQKPIVMYGMGDGAIKILQVMKRYGVAPAAMFASDGFARGNLFMGYKMEKIADTANSGISSPTRKPVVVTAVAP